MKLRMVGKPMVLLLFVFLGMYLEAQEYSTKLEGKVYSKDGDVAATHVTNVTSGRGTIADVNGYFMISVKLNDTLVFSAVQYKPKKLLVTLKILESELFYVSLEDAIRQLDEVTVTPYNLTGDLNRDATRLKVDNVMTASTLGLPNADVKTKTQNERKLLEAKDGAYLKPINISVPLSAGVSIDIPSGVAINLKRILNDLGGRTKTLKNHIEIDKSMVILNRVKRVYKDSIYEQELKIPKDHIFDFMNFCEVDSMYTEVVESNDFLRLWVFLERNSLVYRKNNGLD